ncbi:serine hydrolase domain-containing protein [Salinactinospora qingdaonensis]|uniref:Serine hydrolase n=1 Tax=Salinactinospora qingdaonensis TaxID=702744 RepID=A0ABP7EU48_9ACTN
MSASFALAGKHLCALLTEAGVPGVAAAAIHGPGAADETLFTAGHLKRGSPESVDTRTAFETGSVTKPLTALLLAEMAVRGEVNLTDPVTRHLPPHARPRRDDPPITLGELATHTGGTPRLPREIYCRMAMRRSAGPYAGYTRADLYRATARIRRRRAAGPPRYSTFGFALLGEVLAEVAGTGYPQLLAERVLRPLGMADSGVPPAGDPATRAATGHRRGRPVPPWRFDAIAGAGGLRASAADLLSYLRAQVRPEEAGWPLAEAVLATHVPRYSMAASAEGPAMALAWGHRVTRGHTLLWHTGGTGGFTAFVGFSPTAQAGVAVLANVTPTRGQPVLRAARRLLREVVG